jgi:hypothetical protein
LSLTPGGSFNPALLTAAYDKLTKLVIELYNASQLAVHAPDTEPNAAMLLPTKLERANKYAGFDSNGDATTYSLGTSLNMTGFMQTAVTTYHAAGEARTGFGLAIGSDVQAYDPNLDAFAGLTSAAGKVPYFTGVGTMSTADSSTYGRSLWNASDSSGARSTLELAIGTNVQAYDANLTQIAAVNPTVAQLDPDYTGFILYWSKDTQQWGIQELGGIYAASLYYDSTVTQIRSRFGAQEHDADLDSIAALSTQSYGRSLLTQASAAATRTTLDLGTTYSVYTAGSRPVVTATEAGMDWVDAGSVDPNLPLAAVGTYFVDCKSRLDLVGATFAANRTVTIKLVRRNNTPAAITNGTVTAITPVVTTATQSWIDLHWSIIYSTLNTDDQLGLNWLIDVVPSAGALKASETSIVAVRIL